MQNLNDKLVKVERTINVYLKNENEPLHEINVDVVPFDKLKEIVPPKDDDPLMYDGYWLKKEQIDAINAFLKDKKINPDFQTHDYILVCGGICDWNKNK